jgi:hypothetical protein
MCAGDVSPVVSRALVCEPIDYSDPAKNLSRLRRTLSFSLWVLGESHSCVNNNKHQYVQAQRVSVIVLFDLDVCVIVVCVCDEPGGGHMPVHCPVCMPVISSGGSDPLRNLH